LEGRVLPVAAIAAGGVPPAQVPQGKPVALVLGNEETGPNAAVLAACAGGCTLPALGPVESLNVSAAAAVLFHAFAPGGR
jgi:TrmH RNA methyltransferase